MKIEALDHPKTYDLAARLNCSIPQAIGHLELLWAFVGKKSPRGDVGKWPDGAIARSCFWDEDASEFVQALIDSGFVDMDPDHRLVVHDWHEHMPRWVKAKLAKLRVSPIRSDCSGDCSSHDSSDVSSCDSGDCSGYSVREGKGSEGEVPPYPPSGEPDPGKPKPKSQRRQGCGLTGEAQQRFDRWWQTYPRKVAKPEAVKAWLKIDPDDLLVRRMVAAVDRQRRSEQWQRENGQFIPHPSTWLNQRRWEDEVPPPPAASQRDRAQAEIDARVVHHDS